MDTSNYVFPSLPQTTTFLFLAIIFPFDNFDKKYSKTYSIAIIFSLLTAVVSVSPYLFPSFKDGAPIPGLGMVLSPASRFDICTWRANNFNF